jgi:hypothetical protein
MVTATERELLAQQADLHGWSATARSIRAYLSTGESSERPAEALRVLTFASAGGWDRLPGWPLLRQRLYKPLSIRRLRTLDRSRVRSSDGRCTRRETS